MSSSNPFPSHFESLIMEDDSEDPQRALAKKKKEWIIAKIALLCDDYLKIRKRVSLLVVVVLTLMLTLFLVILIASRRKRPLGDLTIVQLFFGSLLSLGCILTIVVISINYMFTKSIRYVSIGLWCSILVWLMVGSLQTPFTVTSVLAIIIILLYVILPVPMILAVLGGFLAIISLGFSHIRDVDTHDEHLEHSTIIISELACLLAANVFGAYMKFTTDRFHQQTFIQTYDDLRARMELEEERQRQEQLLLSIIPADLAHQMRQSMVERLNEEVGQAHTGMSTRRLWHDFYVREHKQVTILFADLVNFTHLTTKCSAKDLVSMLNEIYGRFDGMARTNDCMRIKTLGDCYCCVSGMPVSRPQHAENVVKTGLQMVQAIKSIRDSTTSILDMRIGVHSGNVLCGVLGTVKWKYDIWSEDVVYANFLESTGVPGKIHVSQATMIQIGDSYTVTEVSPPVLNSLGEPQQTYFIKEANVTSNLQTLEKKTSFQRTRSFSSNSSTQQLHTFLQSWGAPKPFENLANVKVTDDTIPKRSYDMLEASVDSAFFSQSLCQECDPRINLRLDNYCCFRTTQNQHSATLKKAYIKLQSESAFGLSIFSFIYFFFTSMLNCIIFKSHNAVHYISLSGLIFIGFIIYFTIERRNNQNKKPSQVKHSLVAYYFLLTFTMLIHLSFLVVTHYLGLPLDDHPLNCTVESARHTVGRSADLTMLSRSGDLLMILPIFSFIYTKSVVKLIISIITTTIITSVMIAREFNYYTPYTELLRQGSHAKVIPGLIAAIVCYIFISVIMFLYSRQMEKGTDALIMWKTQFHVENVEVETMKNLTKLLLMNILPQHVATYYLERQAEGELYHESYDNVCIMFATIVHFDEFFKMSSDYDREHQCLRLLNEIIGDFDMLLSKPKYSVIEKMKTVGSTYMAAAGLQPGKDISTNEGTFTPASRRTTQQFVQIMTDFALAMFSVLDTINKHSFNNFRLRIGLSNGPVIAGVVGAQKPQYDVWGDTVNMASRMDSGGIIDKIQMTEGTAEALMAAGYPVVCRGKTVVKGKHQLVTTYLLEPNKNSTSIPLRECSSVGSYLSDTGG